jgi:hypothetical protein
MATQTTNETPFNPGDKAVIQSNYGLTLAVIKNVTPTGRIVTDYGGKFAANGWEMGQSFSPRQILPLTPELEEKLLRQNLLRDIPETKWKKLATETLMEIKKLIEGKAE